MDMNIENIIARLKEAVEKSGLTYQQLSEKTKIPKSTLQRWTSGQIKRIPLDDIQVIAAVCGVTAEWIMGWECQSEIQGSTNNTLSVDETKLLTGYRSLSDQGKEYILQTLTMAQQVYKKSDPVPCVDNKIG